MAVGVAFVGGGTRGHVVPNLAVMDRLARLGVPVRPLFLVSDRPGDADPVKTAGYQVVASVARPLPRSLHPVGWATFLRGTAAGFVSARDLLKAQQVRVLVGTGGFVSGPAVMAASSLGIATALINLDAAPGAANRLLARRAGAVFSVHESADLPEVRSIGVPLREPPRASADRTGAKTALGLDDRPLLLVTGATHGGQSMVDAVLAMLDDATVAESLDHWQVLHQHGTLDPAPIRAGYARTGIPATLVDYLPTLTTAWEAADLAISRAGASSVAEAWISATPTVFVPNPHHHDLHQQRNAAPMVRAGAAVVVRELPDAQATTASLGREVSRLAVDPAARRQMAQTAFATAPPDGAAAVAEWICTHLGES